MCIYTYPPAPPGPSSCKDENVFLRPEVQAKLFTGGQNAAMYHRRTHFPQLQFTSTGPTFLGQAGLRGLASQAI